MNKGTIKSIITALLLTVISTAARGQVLYGNPVVRLDCPEPSVLDDRENSGYFYLYTSQTVLEPATKRAVNLPIFRSTDLVNWEFVGDGFPNGHPDWVKGANLWSPDINYIDGRYVLYYSLGKWGGAFCSSCRVAVADSPEGPFEDYDKLIDFRTTGTLNATDPCYFKDHNGSFLLWGGFGGGIFGIELTEDGLFVKPGAKKKLLASVNAEAPLLYEKDGWYYLFASAGACRRGERSTYHILVGRAKHPMGPFTGPDGQPMLKLNYKNTILASSRDRVFVGPGHNSEIITDDEGNDWVLYQSFYAADGYATRQLCLDRIKWNYNGWPYFEAGEPSGSGKRPVFGAIVPKPKPKVKPEAKPEVPVEPETKPQKAADTATGLTGDTGVKTITTTNETVKKTETTDKKSKNARSEETFKVVEPVKVTEPEVVTNPDDEFIQLPGGYSQPRAPYQEELEMFHRLTKNSGLVLTPELVSTQVVAGLNYKFVCKCEDATHRSVGKCQIVVYKPLSGDPEITEMSLLK
ncbi:MAG: family 43 glycosylhydrolase [Bacteroidales bacterium]|nr:family 43 glycosylhydrolase [Bacteroidales bacterium]